MASILSYEPRRTRRAELWDQFGPNIDRPFETPVAMRRES